MKKVWWPAALFAAITLPFTNVSAQSTTALPVSVDMKASISNSNKVMVSWTILLKLSTTYFDIEKSGDGINWHSIALVLPDTSFSIPCTYTSFDLFPVKGANFYRIRMVDATGRTTFTPVKMVRMAAFCNISVYPNPARQQVNIALGQLPQGNWSVTLISAGGQIIAQKNYGKSNTTVSFPIGQVASGNYILEITEGNLKQQKRLLINHS